MKSRYFQLTISSLFLLTGLVGCSFDCCGSQTVPEPAKTAQSQQVQTHNRKHAQPHQVHRAIYDPQKNVIFVSGTHGGGCGRHSYFFDVNKDIAKANTYNVTALDEDPDNDRCEALVHMYAEFNPKEFGIPPGATIQFEYGPTVTFPLAK